MTKNEFLDALKRKIRVLNQNEIQDILDEYSGYIDNKIKDGESEEKAVEDFGNIDDLAREILSAYKLDDDYIRRKNNSDTLLQQIADGLGTFIDQGTQLLARTFENTNAEGLAKIIVSLLIALIGLFFMRIPFWIIEGLGSGILSLVLPNFLEGLFHWLWSIVCNIGYLIFAVILIADVLKKKGIVFQKEIKLKTFMPNSVKDHTVNVDIQKGQDQDKVAFSYEKEGNQKQEFVYQEGKILRNDFKGENHSMNEEDEFDYEEDIIIEEFENDKPRYTYRPQKERSALSSMILLLIKLMLVFFLAPFFLGVIGLSIASGILGFLAFTGAHVWGVFLICAGIAGLLSAFCSLLWNMTKVKKKFASNLIGAIFSAVILGAGTLVFATEFSNYVVTPISASVLGDRLVSTSYDFKLNQVTDFDFYSNEVIFVPTVGAKDNDISVVVEGFSEDSYKLRQQGNRIYADIDNNFRENFKAVQTIIRTTIDGLRNNTFYSYETLSVAKITIYANEATIAKFARMDYGQYKFNH